MPISSRLLLKGEPLIKKKKKKSKSKSKKQEALQAGLKPNELGEHPPNVSKPSEGASVGPSTRVESAQPAKSYEEEFALEMKAAEAGKSKSTPWGSSFATPPKILHGYDCEVKGDTAEERLDIRCARRTDKFCK